MSLLSELKQRNVFRVAVAYLIVAWLLMQVASLMLPQLGLPDWAPTLVTVLLILGLPVALVLAWAYDLTPAGIERAGDAGNAASRSGRSLNFVLVGLAVIAAGVFVAGRLVTNDSAVDVQRIAVLPFDNLSQNADDIYFAAGLHEEVLNQLAKIGGLAVISRSSVLQFAESRPSVPEIAQQLDAQAIVEASVRYAGDQLMVTVQLIDAQTDTHILSETYRADRSVVNEIFSVQADIATEIANQLGAEIAPGERRALDRVPTQSVEAFEHYLRGREFNTALMIEEAMTAFDRAIEADPEFAEAYAMRAFIYSYGQVMSAVRTQLGASRAIDPDAYQDLATENADRAIGIFADNGQAWLARALNHQFHFRWRSAAEAYDRALSLSPGDEYVLREYAQFLYFRGDYEQAQELTGRAMMVDPNGILTLLYAIPILSAGGNAADALAAAERLAVLDPNSAGSNLYLAGMLTDRAERLRIMRRAEASVSQSDKFILIGIAAGYQQLGLDEDVNRVLDEFEAWAQSEDIGAGGWAQYFLARGQPQQALQWYETAIERLESGLSDPGFIALTTLTDAIEVPADIEPELDALRARLDGIKVN